MAAAAALEAAAPTGALWGLVHDFVMGQQEGPADQVAAGGLQLLISSDAPVSAHCDCFKCLSGPGTVVHACNPSTLGGQGDPPTSASQSARITGVSHCARPELFIYW
ncbi:MMS19 nucleotide excision repair protein-like protein [Plecturocebus cupreus]